MLNKYNILKKAVSLLLGVIMLTQLLPMSAIAEEANSTEDSYISWGIPDTGFKKTTPQNVISSEEPTIEYELTDKRTENTKQYRMSDGSTVAAIYNVPVHYLDNGIWTDIDNSLVINDEDGTLENTDSNLLFSFAQNPSNTDLVSVDNGVNRIAMDISANADASVINLESHGDLLTLDNLSSGVVYEDILENTDIEYLITPVGVKENIVVKEAAESYSYDFTLDTDGLTPYKAADNVIYLRDSKGKDIYSITAPIMRDAEGATSTELTLSIDGNTLTVTADSEWINAEERTFPIYIDPSVNSEITYTGMDIAYTSSGNPYDNYHNSERSYIGYSSDEGNHRTYMKFDLPELRTSEMISYAILNLAQVSYLGTSDFNLGVYEVLDSWQPGLITWQSQPNISSTASDVAQLTNQSSGLKQLDITKIIKRWYVDHQNNGIALVDMNENDTVESCAEFAANSGNAYAPVLQITYRDSNGIEDYWTYHSFSNGNAGESNVNDYNGNLIYIHTDAATQGNMLPISVSHIFNQSERNQNEPNAGISCGKGWRLSVIERIKTCTVPGYPYTLTDSDGTVHYFTQTNGTIHLKDDENSVLTDTANEYELTDMSGNRKIFNKTNGYLTKYAYDYTYTDSSNTVQTKEISRTYTYTNGYLTKVTDGAGAQITLSYSPDSNSSTLMLSSITDAAGRTTSYSYTDGRLTSITYANNKTTQFEYDSHGSITKVTQSDGKYTTYTYYSQPPYRTRSITEYAADDEEGKSVFFAYNAGDTVVTDNTGRSEVMQFDTAGRTVSTRDSADRGVFSAYNSTGNSNNTLQYLSDTQSSVVNLLRNPSAERDEGWSSYYADNGSGTLSYSTADKYFSSRSLRIVAPSATSLEGIKAYKQTVTAESEESYTFSAYVKMNYNVYSDDDSGAFLAISYIDTDNQIHMVKSPAIRSATSWERYSVTAKLPEDAQPSINVYAGFDDAAGTVYFDGLQLEKNPSSSKHTLIENGGFNNNSINDCWVNGATTTHQLINGKCIINGNMDTEKKISQTVNISGEEGDTFILSGWGKANALPTSTDTGREFALTATFNYTDETTQTFTSDFESYSENDQYTATELTALKDFTSITVSAVYSDNVYPASFDNIQLTRSLFGTEYGYNTDGQIAWETDSQGNQVQYTYDTEGRVVSTTVYDPDYEIISTDTVEYDDNNNVTSETDENGVVTEYEYDDNGNIIMTTVTKGTLVSVTSSTYSPDGRFKLSDTDESGNTISYSYNTTTGTLASQTDAKGNVTSYTYDPYTDELLSTSGNADVNDVSTSVSNTYTYGDDGLSSIGHNSFNYTFEYDKFGNQTQVKAGNRTLVTNTYGSNNGKLTSSTYGNGDVVTPEYDSLDRVTGISYDNDKKYEFSYSGNDLLECYTDNENNVVWYYAYDNNGNLVRTNGSDGTTIRNTYDVRGQLIGQQMKLGTTNKKTLGYTYTENGLANTMTFGTPHTISWEYDGLDRVTSKTLEWSGSSNEKGYLTEYTYEDGQQTGSTTQRIASIKNSTYVGTTPSYTTVNDLRYTYDANGNIETVSEGATLKVKYYYDESGQLIREDNAYLGNSIKYTYDAGGNLMSKKYYALTFNGTLSTITSLETYSYGDSGWKDLLTSYCGNSITYDQIGNPLTYDGYAYSWEAGRQLSGITGNGLTATYKYNYNGLRTEKTVNGVTTKYIWDGDKLLNMQNSTDNIWFAYDQNGELESLNRNGTYYFVLKNLQGDIIGLYQNGSIVAKYTYDCWGNVISVRDANGNVITSGTHIGNVNPIRYRGYCYDTETGLYYLQSRYYNPQWGRFINADGVFDGYNLFRYCHNDPVNGVDYDGCVQKTVTKSSGTYRFGVTYSYVSLKKYNTYKIITVVLCASGKKVDILSKSYTTRGVTVNIRFKTNKWISCSFTIV